MTKRAKSQHGRLYLPSARDVERIVNTLRSMRTDFSEDIPAFNSRIPGILEGVLGGLSATMFGEELYPSAYEKAASLFYGMCKNHPLRNGNKRVAVSLLVEFLHANSTIFYISEDLLYDQLFNWALFVTESDSLDHKRVLKRLERHLRSISHM